MSSSHSANSSSHPHTHTHTHVDPTVDVAPILALTHQLFHNIQRAQQVSNEDLLSLHALFGSTWEKAVDIVDADWVTLATATHTGRTYFQVQGTSPAPYIVLTNHCTCPAFALTCIQKSDAIFCKHQLAVRLAWALGKYKTITISDEDMMTRLLAATTQAVVTQGYASGYAHGHGTPHKQKH